MVYEYVIQVNKHMYTLKSDYFYLFMSAPFTFIGAGGTTVPTVSSTEAHVAG